MTDDILARFNEIDGQIRDDMTQRRQAAGLVSADRNPDQFARAAKLADRHGVAPELVADNLPDYERKDREDEFTALGERHPEVAPLIADARWRTLAQDDAAGVGRLADALKSPKWRRESLLSKSVYSLFGPLLEGERGQAFLQNLDDAAEVMATESRGLLAASAEAAAEASKNVQGSEKVTVATARSIALGVADPRASGRKEAGARFEAERAKRAAEAAAARDEVSALQQSYGDGTPGYYAMGVARSVPLMAAAVATRNPAVGAGLVGTGTAFQQRSSAIADGATPAQATTSGVVHGTLEGVLDSITLGVARYGAPFVKDTLARAVGPRLADQLLGRAMQSAPGRLATVTATGAATEVPTTLGQMASDEIILDTDYSSEDYARGVRDSIIQGGAMSGGLYVATAPLRGYGDAELTRALSSADDAADLQQITQAARDMRLGERNPEDVAAVAEAVASGERVYLSADDAKVLFQNDPKLLADLVGGDDALTEQLAAGDVSIPMARWVAAVPRLPNAEEIERHARLDPDGISPAEMERLDAEAAEFFGGGAGGGAVSGYVTEKGSRYVVHEDGTTTRNKAARSDPGHEGDSGEKPRSKKTVYVESNAGALSSAGLSGVGARGARVAIKGGRATLLTWNDAAGQWGAAPSGRDIRVYDAPGVGLYPLELWDDVNDVPGYEAYAKMHAGNKIISIDREAGGGAAEQQPSGPDPRQQIIDDVTGQLLATDRYTPAQAEAQAKLWGAMFSQAGRRARQDPFALYQRYMAGIRSGTTSPDPRATRPFQGSARLDALIESVRTGVEPNQAEVFGPSLTAWLAQQGGVQDQTGELRGFDARRLRPGLVNGQGLTLDRARGLAAESGFLPADSTVADFLDLIDRDLRRGDVRSEQLVAADRVGFELERRQFMEAFDSNPRLRDMPRKQLAAMTNQQIAEELFGPAATLNQGPADGTVGADETRSARTGAGRDAFEGLAAIGGRVPAPGWSAATRIRDRDGNPGTVYRGSRDGSTSPDDFGAVGAATGHPSAGLGVWFSASKQDASRYGTVGDYHLDLRKPKIYTTDDAPEFDTIGEAVALRKQLQAAGHDGIVFDFRDVGGPRQFVVFAPEQVIPPAKVLRQDAVPAGDQPQQSQPDNRDLFTRAIDSVKTLFQRKPVDQTKTAEFRRWFGDSKVVDENGEPLVVYHGTRAKFEVFKRQPESDFGFHFGSADQAAGRLSGTRKQSEKKSGEGERILPVFLSIKNPLRVTDPGYFSGLDESFVSELRSLGVRVRNEATHAELRDELERAGYDGLVYENEGGDEAGGDSWVALRPEQIKSATANRGTFDPADPSILNQQTEGDGTRGQISIFPDRRMSITLFERADKSTFIHESAHFFFEVYRDLAADPNAAPEIVEDFGNLLQWFGVDSVDAITDDHLEQFARGFESYVGEGRAPSPELRGVFAKFSAWILGIYRNLRNLNVELTDEVRGVFDRMLASEDEIEVAKVRQGMAPMAVDPSEARALGLTDREFADYLRLTEEATQEARERVFQQTLGALQREQKAWWKEERTKVREEVAGRYEETAAVRALRILSGRRSVSGFELEPPLLGLKLDRDAIVAGWGDAYLKRLGKTYAKAGGVHPDEAATLLGYASGDDLLRALANAPDTIARVDSETDQIMRERHGDPMTDGTLAEKAMAAVHGSKRVRLLERELEILAGLANQPAPNRRLLKAAAERSIAGKTPRQLRPNDYLVAERRAAREALKAVARRDFADALVAKRRQALNVALYSAALDAREQFERDLGYLRRMNTDERRARLGKAGHDYLEQVDGLLEAIELRQASGAEVSRRQRLVEWVRRQEEAGNPVNVPLKLLAEAGLTNVRDMAHADIRGIVDTIKQIEHLAKTKTRLWLAGEERDRDEVDAEMAASVLAAHAARPERTGDVLNGIVSQPGRMLPSLRLERARRFIADIDVGRLLPTNIARELDGYEEGGAVWRNVIRPIREAMYQRVIPAMHAMQEAVAGIYSKHYTPEELRRLDAPVWREAVGDHWSKGRILALAMHWGSNGNREAILTQAQSRLTEEQAVALLRTLDARDWAFVQDMVDQVNSYWPEIAATYRRRTGLAPEKVEAKPFTITNDAGDMIVVRGGYFPLKYDPERSNYGATLTEIDEAYSDLRIGRSAKAATKHGHTIERVGSGGKTVLLELDAAATHMRAVIRDLYLGDAVNYVHSVIHGGDFTKAAASVGLRDHLVALDAWLKDVAVGEMGARSSFEKVVRFARQNTTAAVLSWKASSALLQVTGLVQTGSVIGNRAMLRGVARLLRNAWPGGRSAWSYIRENSAYMRERFGQIADAVELVESQRAGRVKAAHSAMLRWGYVPMARVQMITDAATWLAGEAVGLKKFDGDAEKARAYADDLVIRAQSASDFMDKSAIQRGTLGERHRQSEVVKATTMLLSYMIAKGNIAREKYQATKFTRPEQVLKFTADMVQLFALEAIIMALVRNGLPEDEEDDGLADDWLAYLTKEVGLGALATVPLLSQLATEGRGYTAQGATERGWANLANAMTAWFDDEVDRKDLKQAVLVSGTMAGVPSSQINTTADALWRVHDGEDVAPIDFIIKPERPRE